nr:MAG TPA: hypothetical protein [Caudoviricetes sp.]
MHLLLWSSMTLGHFSDVRVVILVSSPFSSVFEAQLRIKFPVFIRLRRKIYNWEISPFPWVFNACTMGPGVLFGFIGIGKCIPMFAICNFAYKREIIKAGNIRKSMKGSENKPGKRIRIMLIFDIRAICAGYML